MTLEEIKQTMKERDMSITALAEELGVTADGLGRILAGKRPMTEQLARHIEYIFGKREAMLVYRVEVPDCKVMELTAGRGCVTEADHRLALKAIIEHNLHELAKLGAELDWTPEQRAALGIATQQPGAGYDVREPFA